MKVLYISTLGRTGGWLAETLASDRASQVRLEEVLGSTSGLARLRDEAFDAVLISHEPHVLDAVELVEGLRAGGSEEPVIILGTAPDVEMADVCYEVGADGYCCVHTTTTRSLLWMVARAIEHRQLIRENERLVQAQRQRLQREHREAERLLGQQRSLICELEQIGTDELAAGATRGERVAPRNRRITNGASAPPDGPLSKRLASHYRELLQAYVVMGTGNMSREMTQLAAMFSEAHISARQAMQLHVQVLEELIEGLGNRSARHVMNRADLLVLEVMVHLAEQYQDRFQRQQTSPRQATLPGFEVSGQHRAPPRVA